MNGDFNLDKSVGNPGGAPNCWYCASVSCFNSLLAELGNGYIAVGYWIIVEGSDVAFVEDPGGKGMLGNGDM